MENIKPTLVLTIITTLIAGLLIIASTALAVDDSVLSDELRAKCVQLMGDSDYAIVADWKAEGYAIDKPEKVINLIKGTNGSLALQVTADGYEKNGINALIAMSEDGNVAGITIVELAETPGLGSKIDDPDFLSLFTGRNTPVDITKTAPRADNEIQGITGATYSSKGMAKAVNLAIATFKEMEGA